MENVPLKGWKTVITAGLMIGVSVLSVLGYQIPGVELLINQTTDAAVVIVSTVFAILRAVTSTPVGRG